MCSLINVCSVNVLDNPLKLTDPFRIEIVFEVFEYIKDEVEWELIFVATDGNEERDQLLDAVVIGEIRDGRHKFVFEAPAPKLDTLRTEDLTDVTLLLLKCKYREQMFLKVGWFVTHFYTDPELVENPPEQPIPDKMERSISVDDCRVTTYAIKWGDMPDSADAPEQQEEQEEGSTAAVVEGSSSAVETMEAESVSSQAEAPSQTSELNGQVGSLTIDGKGDEAAVGDTPMTTTEEDGVFNETSKPVEVKEIAEKIHQNVTQPLSDKTNS